MRRKILVLLLCISMAAAMFAGCSPQGGSQTPTPTTPPSGGSTQTSEDKVTLKWALWDYESTPYWGALIEEYKKVKPNVTIEYTDLGSTDYMTVLAAELSGSGSEFDVVTIKDVPAMPHWFRRIPLNRWTPISRLQVLICHSMAV